MLRDNRLFRLKTEGNGAVTGRETVQGKKSGARTEKRLKERESGVRIGEWC
mgnify:CR=1 FL=1